MLLNVPLSLVLVLPFLLSLIFGWSEDNLFTDGLELAAEATVQMELRRVCDASVLT